MLFDYDPEDPHALPGHFDLVLDNYSEDFEEYWEVGDSPKESQFTPEDRAGHRHLVELGRAIRHLLHTLTPDTRATTAVREFFEPVDAQTFTPAAVAAIAKIIHQTPIVRDSVTMQLAGDAIGMLLEAQGRVPHLVALFRASPPSARAASYLDRATRLYLWGFDPECVIMARSVLESALASRLYPGRDPDAHAPNLKRLIAEAASNGLLGGIDSGGRPIEGTPLHKCDRIRNVANHVVHAVPVLGSEERGEIGDAHQAINDLAAVLDELFP